MKKQISNPTVLNEAYDYQKQQVSFSRGLKVGNTIYISGTASIDEFGHSVHKNDFTKQAQRAFSNIDALLRTEGYTWRDVVKTTIYIKDIEANYEAFNNVRNSFFERQGVHPYPASVCVQAILCRPELMIEMDAIAIRE